MQHHDAITGTHGLHVSVQYNYDMDKAFKKGSELYAQEVSQHLKDKYGIQPDKLELCKTIVNMT
jgi:hypothetical protein